VAPLSERPFRAGLVLIAGLALLGTALAIHAILLETLVWTLVLGAAGAVVTLAGALALRRELAGLVRHRRGEVALLTLGVVGILLALAYLSVRYPARVDLTSTGRYSLSPATLTMLQRLQKPVHIVFFHDPLMRETVELYELIAHQTPRVTVEFYDPMINPAQARLSGVNFAGTAVLESEGRRLQVNSPARLRERHAARLLPRRPRRA
jgi:4-amino-4-deoxy-L-arabinose transferase-like glycosyltransferase